MLTMQRLAGNAAVCAALSRDRPTVQRVPDPPNPPGPYVAHPAVLGDCVNLLRQVYARFDARSISTLRAWKTIAIGAVVAPEAPDLTIYHWSANGNWNDPAIAAAMDDLGVRRWDADPARQPRGANGAPGDAEQRLMSGDTLKAIAVSRPPCPDCSAALEAYGTEHGHVLVCVVPPPTTPEQQARDRAAEAIRGAAERVRRQLEIYEGEHRIEAAMIEDPSFSGFAGYWTNHLFNRDIPPPTIWANGYGALAGVDSALAAGDLTRATRQLIRARRQVLVAMRNYVSWKDGIEPAGAKAKHAIGAIAVASILAIVALPIAIESLGGAGVGAEVAEEQLAVRIAANIARADEALLALEAEATEAEIQAAVAEELSALEASMAP